jgi:hypothetical protein
MLINTKKKKVLMCLFDSPSYRLNNLFSNINELISHEKLRS